MAQIICHELSVGYDSMIVAENLNFEVNLGDHLYIVGENGAGKSTLMKTVLGLQNPIKGSIIIGEDMGQIGYLPQQTAIQRDFPASVREIVLSGCQVRCGFRPFYSAAEKKLAEKNMERMGILNMAKQSYRELSGGQQQRVLLARALCAAEKILLLDEPVSGLDPKVTMEMYNLINSLNKDGVTIIMISHDVHAAATYASHILHMGNPIFFGTKSEYVNSPIGRKFLSEEGGVSYE